MDQDYTMCAQDRQCYKIASLPRNMGGVLARIAPQVPPCVGCSGKPRQLCLFYKVDARKRVLEQRSFKVSADYKILDIIPHEHRDHKKPTFDPLPPATTKEIVDESMRAAACILVPELERHMALRQTCSSVVYRTPKLDDSREICDLCKMSLLCCVRLCKACGRQVCDKCYNEGRMHTKENLCTRKPPLNGHDFALEEFFQPNELEDALSILRPLPHPALVDTSEPEILHFDLTNRDKLPTYSDVYCALASGTPMVVSGINAGEDNLTPEYFIDKHGSCKVTVRNTKTLEKRSITLGTFMKTFGSPIDPSNPERIQDWPPTANFATEYPKLFKLFEEVIVAPVITSRTGALNMEINMPDGSCPPDTGPKAYLAQGAAGGTTTRLHCDMTDAINIMFYAEDADKDTVCGAEWTMIARESMPLAERLLRERMEGQFEGHPIHSQQLILSDDDVAFLRENGVRVWVFTQKPGEAVFIPAGVGHQVTNLTSCIKIAVDFVTPCNVEFSRKVGEELREHRLTQPGNEDEDVLQLTGMCWWRYKRWQTTGLCNATSAPASDPRWSDYVATPRYMDLSIRAHDCAQDPSPSFDDEGTTPYQAAFDALSLSAAPFSTSAPSSSALFASHRRAASPPAPPSLTAPTLAPPGAGPSSSVPFKRKSDEYGDMSSSQRRHDRQRLRRAFTTLRSPQRALTCPVGDAGGPCTRPGELFDREELLAHLEACHRDFVTFRKPGAHKVMVRITRKNILNMYPGDDAAFRRHLEEHVLERAAFSLQ